MTAISLFTAPAARAIAKLGSTLTYEEVPSAVNERADSVPYLGHIPYFAPKLEEAGNSEDSE